MSTAIVSTSVTPTSWQIGGTTTVITKPSGTQDGDLLIAVLSGRAAVGGNISSAPSGWTLLQTGRVDIGYLYVYTKIASGEPSSWTWVWDDNSVDARGWACLCVSPSNQSTPISTSNVASVANSATPSFANTITPTNPNSLMIMIVGEIDDNNLGMSGYAIATDNPSWTEIVETINSASDGTLSIAIANRSQTTATGNSTVNAATGSDTICVILAVNIADAFTGSDTIVSSDAETALRGRSFAGSDTITVSDSVNDIGQRIWKTISKVLKSWRNPNKT